MIPKISIITPVLDHPEFAAAYAAATIEAECIIVDTGSTPEHKEAWGRVGKLITYPSSGHNYGHWCNAGYQEATGDVIVFLNNDVAAAGDWLSDVGNISDGAIYGPELQAQHVAGVNVPFLSGWCIAATRQTWERVAHWEPRLHPLPSGGGALFSVPVGPWNTVDYPAAGYWEDNDLSLRAILAGLELRQTRWSITHLDGGNGTSKHKRDYYADVGRNRATFERSVRAAMRTPNLHAGAATMADDFNAPLEVSHAALA